MALLNDGIPFSPVRELVVSNIMGCREYGVGT